MKRLAIAGMLLVSATLAVLPQADAQGLRDRMQQGREASRQERPVAVPAGGTAIRNIPYGPDPAQRLDLYLPANASRAPVVFYVHGGGWANGDKTNPGLANKLAYWLPKGYAVISSNYRMVPVAMPLEQARDIARGVAMAQQRAGEWKLDPARVVLMGHSAGAHLVALLGADPRLLSETGAKPPLGVVSLDSGALDVPALMGQRRVPKLYHEAFGADPAYWRSASPQQQLGRDGLPMLLVCASERGFPTSPCDEARKLARRAEALRVPMRVQPEPMNHGEINKDLGLRSDYTRRVGAWIDQLTGAAGPR
ncbi:MAG TPA: alpha/beta hydrolase [Thermomonas sp.]|nr:alpha/beta hydrolase [Thermomonas sp.]